MFHRCLNSSSSLAVVEITTALVSVRGSYQVLPYIAHKPPVRSDNHRFKPCGSTCSWNALHVFDNRSYSFRDFRKTDILAAFWLSVFLSVSLRSLASSEKAISILSLSICTFGKRGSKWSGRVCWSRMLSWKCSGLGIRLYLLQNKRPKCIFISPVNGSSVNPNRNALAVPNASGDRDCLPGCDALHRPLGWCFPGCSCPGSILEFMDGGDDDLSGIFSRIRPGPGYFRIDQVGYLRSGKSSTDLCIQIDTIHHDNDCRTFQFLILS